ncbi:MAG: YceI family protein [Maritimibacter sp.]|nr:YceI family protein [Maritimibacter sp.]
MKLAHFFFAPVLALLPVGLQAAPVAYVLDQAQSQVGFEVMFGQDPITGTMPIAEAQVAIDFEQASNSSVSAVIDAARSQASFPFATQAMLGPKVLATDQFPTMTFRSRAMHFSGTTAEVEGDLTLRGVTRPVQLHAELYRQKGTEEGDRTKMSVLLTGAVKRSDFGATGWDDMVGDQIKLKILVRINQAG